MLAFFNHHHVRVWAISDESLGFATKWYTWPQQSIARFHMLSFRRSQTSTIVRSDVCWTIILGLNLFRFESPWIRGFRASHGPNCESMWRHAVDCCGPCGQVGFFASTHTSRPGCLVPYGLYSYHGSSTYAMVDWVFAECRHKVVREEFSDYEIIGLYSCW